MIGECKMVKNLYDLLNTISVLERLNTKYYNLNDFHDALDKISGEEVEVDDTYSNSFLHM